MERLFERWPHAIRATREVADSIDFSLDELRYEYPRESVPEGRSPQQQLEHLTWAGAARHWPDGVPDKVVNQVRHEFALIEKLDFARYFLTVHDIVAFARIARPADPVPGARVGGEQRGLLLPWHHRGEPGRERPVVRAVH